MTASRRTSGRRWTAGPAVVAAAVLLAGCSGAENADPPASPTPTPLTAGEATAPSSAPPSSAARSSAAPAAASTASGQPSTPATASLAGTTAGPGSSPTAGPTAGGSAGVTGSPAGPVSRVTAADAVTGLQVPWGIAVLPDGRALVTERNSGRVLLVVGGGAGGGTVAGEAGTVDGVDARGEAGLLGIAVSPSFAENRLLAVYFSTAEDNRVMTFTLGADDKLTGGRVILDGLPVASTHDGGRLLWAPDGNLFVTVGDAGQAERAQQLDYLGGKILRITADGSPAAGNPFPDNPLVYSYGHRNPQGLALDADGRLWEAEFGQNTWDELNLIRPGGNYGWPIVEGRSDDPRFVSPQQVWPTSDASPSGIAIWRGAVWMAALRGERLWQIPLDGDRTGTPVAHLEGEFGRLRTVVVAPDGNLWVSTSNTDGRGDPRDGDDRILRLSGS